MTRYAAFAALWLVFAAVAFVEQTAWTLVVLAGLPFVWAWGPYLADVQLNPALDDAERNRWRMALWFLPAALPAYWYLHVHPRRPAA